MTTAPRTARLSDAVVADLTRWTDAAHPREACGLLFGCRRGEDFEVCRASRARNVAIDPRRFEIDPGHFVRAVDESAATGVEVIGVWHSHPDTAAVPSPEDRQAAWPEHLHLIVGPAQAGRARVRAWRDRELAVLRDEVAP